MVLIEPPRNTILSDFLPGRPRTVRLRLPHDLPYELRDNIDCTEHDVDSTTSSDTTTKRLNIYHTVLYYSDSLLFTMERHPAPFFSHLL